MDPPGRPHIAISHPTGSYLLTNINHGDILRRRNEKPADDERHFRDNERGSPPDGIHEVPTDDAAYGRAGCAETRCNEDTPVKQS